MVRDAGELGVNVVEKGSIGGVRKEEIDGVASVMRRKVNRLVKIKGG